MNEATPPNRCRIVLIAPPGASAQSIAMAFEGGDVASLILPENGMDEASFQAFAEQIVPAASRPTAFMSRSTRPSLPRRSDISRQR